MHPILINVQFVAENVSCLFIYANGTFVKYVKDRQEICSRWEIDEQQICQGWKKDGEEIRQR